MTKNAKNPKYPYCTLFSLTGELVELDITVGTGEGAKVGELSTTVSYVEEGEMGEGEKLKKVERMKVEKKKVVREKKIFNPFLEKYFITTRDKL